MTRSNALHATGLAALLAMLALAGCATPSPDQAPAPAEPATPEAPAEPEQPREEETAEPAAEDRPEDTAETAAREQAEREQRPRGLSGANLYRLLVADLAGRRGDLDVALQGYLETARETRDPRVAERATRLALYADRADAAMEGARRWADLAPDDAEAHAVLARLHLRRGEVDAATSELHRVIELTEGGVEAGLSRITSIVTGSRDAGAALAAMERIVAEHGGRARAHYALAELASEVGRDQLALRALERALDLEPGYTAALVLRAEVQLELGRGSEAFSRLRRAQRDHPDDRELALGYVRLLVESDRLETGRREMQRIHERFGDDPEAVYSLALLAMQAEIWTDARLYLERLLQMDARTSQAHYYLGRIAQQEGECTRALQHYIKVGQGEHRFDAELRAAICMAEVDRIGEARLHLERMRTRYDSEGALVQVVMTHARVERMGGNGDAALEVLARGIERFPDNEDLRYARALAAAEMDRFERARADLNAILEQEPDNARALNALGYMLADRNTELRRARSMIERALEQNPDDPATIDSMGWVLYRLGQPRAALSHLRRAWELDPDPEIAAHLGEVLWSLGRRDEARRIWERAREQAPDSAVLEETVERLER